MQSPIEQYLDHAISRIQNGENISLVVSDYPQNVQEDLASMLAMVKTVSSLPLKAVPTPTKRKLYLEHQQNRSFVPQFLNSFKMLSTVLASIVILISGTSFAAANSIPGETLFTLKKNFQQFRLTLTTNPEKRADLQLEFAVQRLQEAKQALSENDTEKSKAAIAELQTQTKAALKEVKVAVAISSNNTDIVEKAETIAKSQNTLVAQSDTKGAEENEAQTKTALHEIKKIVAASNEESNAIINPAAKVETTGKIKSIEDSIIVVGVNTFQILNSTEFFNKDGSLLTASDIKVGDTVKILAHLKEQDNIADTITVMATAEAEKAAQDKAKEEKAKIIVPEIKTIPEPVVNKKDTHTGFIIEPPASFEK
ncbi:MAG: DUF5667 domain-containing protein [Candidatus Doudnabacteria bacterium]